MACVIDLAVVPSTNSDAGEPQFLFAFLLKVTSAVFTFSRVIQATPVRSVPIIL